MAHSGYALVPASYLSNWGTRCRQNSSTQPRDGKKFELAVFPAPGPLARPCYLQISVTQVSESNAWTNHYLCCLVCLSGYCWIVASVDCPHFQLCWGSRHPTECDCYSYSCLICRFADFGGKASFGFCPGFVAACCSWGGFSAFSKLLRSESRIQPCSLRYPCYPDQFCWYLCQQCYLLRNLAHCCFGGSRFYLNCEGIDCCSLIDFGSCGHLYWPNLPTQQLYSTWIALCLTQSWYHHHSYSHNYWDLKNDHLAVGHLDLSN